MSDNSTATTPVDSREAQQGKGMRVSGEPGSELAAPPVGTSPASAANDAAGERPGGPDIDRDLHRLLAGAVTDHLERAAALLRQDPTVDALLLGAGGAAKVIAVLSTAATRIGVCAAAFRGGPGHPGAARVGLHGQRRRLQAGTATQRIVVTAPRYHGALAPRLRG